MGETTVVKAVLQCSNIQLQVYHMRKQFTTTLSALTMATLQHNEAKITFQLSGNEERRYTGACSRLQPIEECKLVLRTASIAGLITVWKVQCANKGVGWLLKVQIKTSSWSLTHRYLCHCEQSVFIFLSKWQKPQSPILLLLFLFKHCLQSD